ncbi:MAG: hypothetical protein LBO69_02930 [Ignavibacteria bacterium]|jgi:hypothetical protein|nr:hypothetical protein [Ignavibacteria bacterium]
MQNSRSKSVINYLIISVFIALIIASCVSTKERHSNRYIGSVSEKYFNGGDTLGIIWDADEDGIFTKFYNDETNCVIIVRNGYYDKFYGVVSKSGETMISCQNATVVVDGNTGAIIKVDSKGKIEYGDK